MAAVWSVRLLVSRGQGDRELKAIVVSFSMLATMAVTSGLHDRPAIAAHSAARLWLVLEMQRRIGSGRTSRFPRETASGRSVPTTVPGRRCERLRPWPPRRLGAQQRLTDRRYTAAERGAGAKRWWRGEGKRLLDVLYVYSTSTSTLSYTSATVK